ncbi:MAG TPA: phospholipase D-like domain-containing protein [Kofleriaceae bacterium]|nr:phospholipase D-like domain-containing protein [Kofleriaceae bacterium]
MNRRSIQSLLIAVLAVGCRNSEQATGDAGGSDAGATADADPQVGCQPLDPRTSAPEVFIGPTEIEDSVLPVIAHAQDTLVVMMYQLSQESFIDAIVAAAGRGVSVRVVLDPDQNNSDAKAAFDAAGVQYKDASLSWENYHAKVVLADDDLGVVMSGNMNYFTTNSERNYGVVLRDRDDLADIATIFDMDWDGITTGYPTCTRLLISPTNARQRILQHINSAQETLDFEVMYISDDTVLQAVIDRHDAGVAVRVLLADPNWIDGNDATAATLRAAGVSAKYLKTYGVHAKLIVADGAAFIGSQNFSWTSLERNREMGVLIDDAAGMARIDDQFEVDWAAGVE